MRQLTRLVRYVFPFLPQLLPGVLLLAGVGFLEAFRLVLLKPVLDRVLVPASGSENIVLFTIPRSGHAIYLQRFVPSHFHNAWTIVAYALVASTVLKGIFDYCGTYLVNHAGFGMITDLRNDLYNSVLRRSSAFFQKHATGTLISTIINDIERVQYAMSSVLAEFLQQLFTFLYRGRGGGAGARPGVGVAAVCPVHRFVGGAHRSARADYDAARAGQVGGHAKYSARDHHRKPHRQSVRNSEKWEVSRFAEAANRLFRANLRSVAATAISSPLMDIFGSICISLCCCCWAANGLLTTR